MAGEEEIFGILREILRKEFPDSNIFIGDYSEDAICIRKAEDGYHVFNGTRNKEEDLAVIEDIMEAVKALIYRLCYDEAQTQNIYDEIVKKIG